MQPTIGVSAYALFPLISPPTGDNWRKHPHSLISRSPCRNEDGSTARLTNCCAVITLALCCRCELGRTLALASSPARTPTMRGEPCMNDLARHREAERFMHSVYNVTDYAVYALSPEGLVMHWTAGAGRCQGYTEAELLGKHFSLLYPEEDRAPVIRTRCCKSRPRADSKKMAGWQGKMAPDSGRAWC